MQIIQLAARLAAVRRQDLPVLSIKHGGQAHVRSYCRMYQSRPAVPQELCRGCGDFERCAANRAGAGASDAARAHREERIETIKRLRRDYDGRQGALHQLYGMARKRVIQALRERDEGDE